MFKKKTGTLLAAAALAAGVLGVTTTTAQATTANGYVDGSGPIHDDWSDEGMLSVTQHPRSGATGLWQMVLWQDGYLTEADVDCKFGARTQEATKRWQADHLGASEADGVVGPKTFGKASQNLDYGSSGSILYKKQYLGREPGSNRYFFSTDYSHGFIFADYNSMTGCP
ncbi:peptidoglycan-binding protein [Streptomyces sp. VRA16 Mangrove soil]|uniref:peptidoglycan-binding domain-containing protein n=1 Tax=Streptomyces sp. VRA16 Mangrove soil TaxID=2817434 RepID=UPI001A9D5091|nr:peptidoglycan-binding protein [Streptomyces sp. VRA16 Mangrove soil]MBO1331396.1 peptidoglycan-binding protein [Streptomyces sp. VRA16 Mangrove soil]